MLPTFCQPPTVANKVRCSLGQHQSFTPFNRSVHELARHYTTPLLHSALQRSKVLPAEMLRMTAYQPIEKLRGRGIRLALKPVQYVASPHPLNRVRMSPPGTRLSRFWRFCLVCFTNLALSPQVGQPIEKLLQILAVQCTHRGGVFEGDKCRLRFPYRVQQRNQV